MQLAKTLAAIVLSTCFVASPAAAISVNFSGIVTSGSGDVSAGDVLTGSYTFIEGKAPELGGTDEQSIFNAVTSFNFDIGGGKITGTFSAPGGGAEIQQDDFGPVQSVTDRYNVTSRVAQGLSVGGSSALAATIAALGISMFDSTNTAITDASVLISDPHLSDFDTALFFLFDAQFGSPVSGTITSFSAVPLPASLLLLLGGIAVLGGVSHRRAA